MASIENEDQCKLEELSESDFEIVDGQPEILGWDVRDSEGNKLGEVDELLFNPQSRRVRYIILHMESNDIGLEDGRVLIPIGVAELHEDNDNVVIPQVTKAQVLALPLYERGRLIDADTEAQVRNVFVAPDANVMVGTDFYDHDHFSETKFYGKRRQPGAETQPLNQSYLDDAPPTGDSAEQQKYNRDNIV